MRHLVEVTIMMISILVLSCMVMFLIVIYSFFDDGGLVTCSDNLVFESESHNRKYVASVFVGSCGATTPFVTSVTLHRATDTFVADSDGLHASGKILSIEGKVDIRIIWKTDLNVLILYPNYNETRNQLKWEDVIVEFGFL